MKEALKKKFEFLTKETRTKKTRFLISLAIHFFAVFTLIFCVPVETYLSSIADFDFAFHSLLLVMGGAAIILLAVGILISMLLKGRLFNYYITTIFSFTLCSFIQGFFMNGSLPALDGTPVQWHLMTKSAFLNLLVWSICFSMPYIIHFFNRKFWKKTIVYISCLCIIMNAATLITSLVTSNVWEKAPEGFYSKENLYETSNEGDIVVLLLDYFDNEYMDELLQEEPEALSEWTGFTRLSNCSGMYKQTNPSVDYLLTGEKWNFETPLAEFPSKAYSSSDFLQRIKDQGLEVNLYVSGFAASSKAHELADNYNYVTPKVNPLGMFSSMMNYMLYRNMPTITKSVFWHYTDDISNASVKTENLSLEETTYTINDPQFYSEFKDDGLELSQNRSFKFIHTMGAHYPFVMNELGEASNETDGPRQRRGSIHIVSQYLSQMKEQGTYDNSTIIIIADHGEVEVADEMSRAANPILFVKPAGADSSTPYTTSTAPVSQEDFHATVLWAAGDENYSDFGRTFFEIEENEKRVRNYYYRVAYDGKKETSLIEYEIKGDARNFSNWRKNQIWGDLAK